MAKEDVIGVFIGLESSTFEYIAEIIAPYNSEFRISIGDFLLISGINEYIVARIIEYRPIGELTSFMGQKWLSDVTQDLDSIGQDIKERKIRYSVKIKILGSLKGKEFSPGIATIPHITSKVIKPSRDQLESIILAVNKDQEKGIEIGSYYLNKSIRIKFDESQLNSKRTFIFARAGFGKSNLMKLIAANWPKGNGGLLIFDPEGEYAITDVKGRPGIMDQREAIWITNREPEPSDLKNVYRNLKVNLKDFSPSFIIPLLINETKHENIFFQKLMGLEKEQWDQLVDLLYESGWRTPLSQIREIIISNQNEESSAHRDEDFKPIYNNLVGPIRKLHDPDSKLLNIIIKAMKKDEVVILDISLLDSDTALKLSSIIVKHIFNKNQENFVGNKKEIIKATFVVEEAQSVLNQNSGISTFIELAKEGRKYSLGGIFITQQPGSISQEILSQADNFFVFHLLSKYDLDNLKNANFSYSNDIITQILSEPIEGKCYMWTSKQPFVLTVQIDNIQNIFKPNNAQAVQSSRSPALLDLIKEEIYNELNDPILISIRNKKKEVENIARVSNMPPKKRTVELFNRLTDEEKQYLREKGRIQKNSEGKEFAVTFKFYNSI
ncbi:MAG TPA: ATP-binding protein [Thermodesulfobium narugense]|nr:ATP-binding protein [Thermodesulfobium narugense]